MTYEGVALVPEFCMVTGITEETWNSSGKFNLIRDIINTTQPEVQRRIVDIKRDFFDLIKLPSDAEIRLQSLPHIVEGVRVETPMLQMAKLPQGPRVEISTSRIEELERKIFS